MSESYGEIEMNLRKILRILPDRLYLDLMFFKHFKRFPNWDNPKTYNEKLQWLKLHDRKPEYTDLVDKIKVKEIVGKKIGEEHIIKTLGVWDKAEDIDFEKLPNQFVLKCNHDSKSTIVCLDKNKFNIDSARIKLNEKLKVNAFWYGREWPYKNVIPKIICEEFIGEGNVIPSDYKIMCMNGIPKNIMICSGRNVFGKNATYSFYDFKGNKLNYLKSCLESDSDLGSDHFINQSDKLQEMYSIAKKLSKELKHSRIDLYEVNGKVYFGEITFFPASGVDTDYHEQVDLLLGEQLQL